MPESNGKSNFTATLMRKGASMFDTNSYTFALSEYPDRVRYEADCMRYLIGELDRAPFILDYDADKHSGYVEPAPATQQASAIPAHACEIDLASAPVVFSKNGGPDEATQQAGAAVASECESCEGHGMVRGHNMYLDHDPRTIPCADCDGTGRISPNELCARCDQSGILPAATAASTPTCPHCEKDALAPAHKDGDVQHYQCGECLNHSHAATTASASEGKAWTADEIADACVKAGLGILECNSLIVTLKGTGCTPAPSRP
jgi:hypothetical protein